MESVIHSNFAMRKIVGISLISWLLTTSCNTSSEPSFEETTPTRISIAQLKTLCRGTSTLLTQPLSIAGIVTANDIRDEFSHTIVVQDAAGGVEISIDHTTLADLFPLGAAVTVQCTGLAVGDYGGKIILGAKPTNSYCVDRIARAEIQRYIRCTALNAHQRRPRTLRFTEVGAAVIDTYVHFEGVHFTQTEAKWCDYDPTTDAWLATNRTLEDLDGNQLLVRTLPRCHYATEPIPQGTGSVNGIINYFNGEFSLRIINYEVDFE